MHGRVNGMIPAVVEAERRLHSTLFERATILGRRAGRELRQV